MTTTCSHRHLHEHTQAPTGRWLKRLTKVCGPAPVRAVPVRHGTPLAPTGQAVAAVHDTPPGAERLDRADRREVPLLKTPRLDLLLRSRAA